MPAHRLLVKQLSHTGDVRSDPHKRGEFLAATGKREPASGQGIAGETDLTIWVASLSLLLGEVAIALCACRPLVRLSQIMPSLIAALHATPLAAAHRNRHEEHHEHHGYRNDDYNDSRRYGCNRDH